MLKYCLTLFLAFMSLSGYSAITITVGAGNSNHPDLNTPALLSLPAGTWVITGSGGWTSTNPDYPTESFCTFLGRSPLGSIDACFAAVGVSGAVSSFTVTGPCTLSAGHCFNSNYPVTGSFTLTATCVDTAPVLQGPFTLTATIGTPFSYSALATGSSTITYSYSMSWPYTPTGNFSFTATATNSVGFDTKTYTVNVAAPSSVPVLQGPFNLNGTTGQPFSYSAVATGTSPITYSYSMSWPYTPTAAGNFAFTVTATNSAGTDTKTYTVTVAAGAPDMSSTNSKIDAGNDLVKQTNAVLATLDNSVNNVGLKVDAVGTKIDTTNSKLDTVGTKIDTTNSKLDSMDTHLENIDNNITIIRNDINGIQTGISKIGTDTGTIVTNLDDLKGLVDSTNSKLTTINEGIIMSNEALSTIVTNSTSTDIRVASIDSKMDTVSSYLNEHSEKLDNMADLLQQIADNTAATAQNTGSLTSGSINAPALPSLSSNTAVYTDDQVNSKVSLPAWTFVKGKIDGLNAVGISGYDRFDFNVPGVPLPSENGMIISQDSTLSSYIAGCRTTLKIIVWLLGLWYWLQIFMGIFI